MKTLTVNHREKESFYNGKFVMRFNDKATISDIEGLAEDLGYTHIRWLRLPIGKGDTRSKIGH